MLPGGQGPRAASAATQPEFHFYWMGGESPPRSLRRDPQRPPASIGFSFYVEPREGAIADWTATVTASAQPLASEVQAVPGGGEIYYRIDPCKVAGLDTPGTQIPIDYEFVFAISGPDYSLNPPIVKGSYVLTLVPDTAAPLWTYSGFSAATVQRDQSIKVYFDFTDDSASMGGEPMWDSGLRMLSLEGPSNPGQVGAQVHVVDESPPQTCGEKVTTARHGFDYTVPHSAQPGDQIKLLLVAEDWAGNRTEHEESLTVVGPEPDEEPQATAPTDDATGEGSGESSFPPNSDCSDTRVASFQYQGLNNECDGWLHICGETLDVSCPFEGFAALATNVNGPRICCDDWRKARKSHQPCDVGQDADCDGIDNTDDNDPLRTGSPPARPYRR